MKFIQDFQPAQFSRNLTYRLNQMEDFVMSEKDKLFRAIQMYDFALYEIKLYLDTHPNCRKGLDYFHKYNDLKKAAEEEYINLYGPIVSSQVKSRDRWTWVNEPWPWEGGAD